VIKIKFFGKLREKFGQEMVLPKRFENIEDLLNFLIQKDKSLNDIKEHLIFSINYRYATKRDKINDGDIITIIISPTGG